MIIFESEKELEVLLCKELDNGVWIVEDEHVDCWQSQTNLGSHGITDIITSTVTMDLDENGKEFISSKTLKVIELKITELSYSHLGQISRYKDFFDNMTTESDVDEYVLVCKSGDVDRDLMYLAQSLDWLSIYLYEFSLTKGVVFRDFNNWEEEIDWGKAEVARDKIKAHFFNGGDV